MRTRIKICGITRPGDAQAAALAGADAVGLVFYPPSPRFVSLERAVEIRDALPPFVQSVALFVNPDAAQVAQVIGRVRPAAGFARGITAFIEKDDLLPFEEAKLYGHNAIHALIGYLAHERGLTLMSQVAGR